MKVEDLKIPSSAIKFLKSEGYYELFPPQADCVKAGLLDGESLIVSAPTASGKTLTALLGMISYLSKNSGKVIYLSPLRALASEKFKEFKKLEKLSLKDNLKVVISTGDYENVEKNLEKADVLVLTNEKMDSVIRHRVDWISQIGLVISDELHLIGDDSRGPTLEMVLTQLKLLSPKPQILGLSATITNSSQLAEWLNCKLVENTWRPVPLIEGVYGQGEVKMNDGSISEISNTLRGAAIDLGVQAIEKGGQSLIFAETRTRSKTLAIKGSEVISKLLTENEKKSLENTSEKILEKNEQTETVKILSNLIKKGVAFHHAGLNQNCRETVENEFRNGKIKLLTSTPTLAAGVNLPARRVIISSISRYDTRSGMNKHISVLEYKQLCGRAGRPQYDKFGESIIVGSNNVEDLMDYYVNGQPEPILSKITDDKSLRTHVLSYIVTNPGIKKDQILEFFMETLGGNQSRKMNLKFAIDISLRFLSSESLIIRKGERFAASEFGKITSMLYIDPVTATSFRTAINNCSKKKNHVLGFLHLITNAEEFFPKFSLRNKDYETASILIENRTSELLEPISEYDCSRSLLALDYWLNEHSEIKMSENLRIESGDLHRMVEISNWLLFCLKEVSKHLERSDLIKEIETLRLRVTYGIKEELIDLVKIKGIGRVRARVLYKNGIRSLDDLALISVKKLSEIDKIGLTLAENIKSQI